MIETIMKYGFLLTKHRLLINYQRLKQVATGIGVDLLKIRIFVNSNANRGLNESHSVTSHIFINI